MNLFLNFLLFIIFHHLSKHVIHSVQNKPSKPFQNVKNYKNISEKVIIIKLNNTYFSNQIISEHRHHNHQKLNVNNISNISTFLINEQPILYSTNDTQNSTNSTISNVYSPVDLFLIIVKSIFLFLMILLIIIGNTLVILTVSIVKKLHTKDNANNLLILSLSVSDLLVGLLVLPLAFYSEIIEGHKYDIILLFIFIDYYFNYYFCYVALYFRVFISVYKKMTYNRKVFPLD